MTDIPVRPGNDEGPKDIPVRNVDAILRELDFVPDPFRCENAHCEAGHPVAAALAVAAPCRPRPCDRVIEPLLLCRPCVDRARHLTCARCGHVTYQKVVRWI